MRWFKSGPQKFCIQTKKCIDYTEKWLFIMVVFLYNLYIFVLTTTRLLTLLLLNATCSVSAISVNSDQLANWIGSTLFVIKYVNLYQKPRSSNLIGWKLEVGMAP